MTATEHQPQPLNGTPGTEPAAPPRRTASTSTFQLAIELLFLVAQGAQLFVGRAALIREFLGKVHALAADKPGGHAALFLQFVHQQAAGFRELHERFDFRRTLHHGVLFQNSLTSEDRRDKKRDRDDNLNAEADFQVF